MGKKHRENITLVITICLVNLKNIYVSRVFALVKGSKVRCLLHTCS